MNTVSPNLVSSVDKTLQYLRDRIALYECARTNLWHLSRAGVVEHKKKRYQASGRQRRVLTVSSLSECQDLSNFVSTLIRLNPSAAVFRS